MSAVLRGKEEAISPIHLVRVGSISSGPQAEVLFPEREIIIWQRCHYIILSGGTCGLCEPRTWWRVDSPTKQLVFVTGS